MPSDVSREGLSEAEIRDRVRAQLAERTRSPRSIAQALGVSRGTVISLAAGVPVARGTIALVRERFAMGF